MSVNGFEALAVALIFLAPGALFTYVVAAYYSPNLREQFLRRQFPLQQALHYLLASVSIHSILLFFLAAALTFFVSKPGAPNPIAKWYSLLSDPQLLSPRQLFQIVTFAVVYLMLSLALAYLAARVLRRRFLLPESLWAKEIMAILARDEPADVTIVGRSGESIVGRLAKFRYIGNQGKEFELVLFRVSDDGDTDTIIWTDSRVIRALHVTTRTKAWALVFPREERDSRESDPSSAWHGGDVRCQSNPE